MIVGEQHPRIALDPAGEAVVLERGRVWLSGTHDKFLARWDDTEDMLAVTH